MKRIVACITILCLLITSSAFLVGCNPIPSREEVKKRAERIAQASHPVEKQPSVTPVKPTEKNKIVSILSVGKIQNGKARIKMTGAYLPGNMEVHLVIGYCYYTTKVVKDGVAEVDVEWTPPGNQRVSAGIFNADTGRYVSSILVSP